MHGFFSVDAFSMEEKKDLIIFDLILMRALVPSIKKKIEIHYLHNPMIHFFYPQTFCIIIVCKFSWDMKMS